MYWNKNPSSPDSKSNTIILPLVPLSSSTHKYANNIGQ